MYGSVCAQCRGCSADTYIFHQTHLLIKDGTMEPIFLLNKVARLGIEHTCHMHILTCENGATSNFHADNLWPECMSEANL